MRTFSDLWRRGGISVALPLTFERAVAPSCVTCHLDGMPRRSMASVSSLVITIIRGVPKGLCLAARATAWSAVRSPRCGVAAYPASQGHLSL